MIKNPIKKSQILFVKGTKEMLTSELAYKNVCHGTPYTDRFHLLSCHYELNNAGLLTYF